MLKAVLFDLDNTLIRFSERKFIEAYIVKVVPLFSDMIPPEAFLERLVFSVRALLNNNGEMSNMQYFMRHFSTGYEERSAEIWRRFTEFYDTQFDQFRELVSVPQGGREVFAQLKQKGVKLVIASNPIWPMQVQMKRLSWADLGDMQFDLVTSLENMSYCKPRLEYYQETCLKIGESPQSCLMVGNDPVNDMSVATMGMKTFLVTDEGRIDESGIELSRKGWPDERAASPKPDFEGPLSDVPAAVDALIRL